MENAKQTGKTAKFGSKTGKFLKKNSPAGGVQENATMLDTT
jgi:hypothetical protein